MRPKLGHIKEQPRACFAGAGLLNNYYARPIKRLGFNKIGNEFIKFFDV
jgi:hypothetical protein